MSGLTTTAIIVITAVLAGLAMLVVALQSPRGQIARRLARMERKLDALLTVAHLDASADHAPQAAWPADAATAAGRDAPGLARLERKLDAALARLSVTYNDESADPVRNLVRSGEQIAAIKRYREQHPGVGLREAKTMVDAIATEEHIH